MEKIKLDGYTRISKKEARKLFNSNKTIYLQRVMFKPVNCWSNCMPLNRVTSDKTFEQNVSEFEYYNCTDSQTGRYASFYIKEV